MNYGWTCICKKRLISTKNKNMLNLLKNAFWNCVFAMTKIGKSPKTEELVTCKRNK